MTVATVCCVGYAMGYLHGWIRGKRTAKARRSIAESGWVRIIRKGHVNTKPAGPTPPVPVQTARRPDRGRMRRNRARSITSPRVCPWCGGGMDITAAEPHRCVEQTSKART